MSTSPPSLACMALSVRSSPPLILEAGGRPPTVIEWEQLREFITHSYKTKQHTARKIREELGNHGFAVTEKLLRARLKNWRIDDKNRRRSNKSTSRPFVRSFRIGPPGDSQTVDQESREHSVMSTKTRSTRDLNALDDNTSNGFPQPGDQNDRSLMISPRNSVASPPLDPTIELEAQHLLFEVGNWYDHLASPEHHRQTVPNAERAMLSKFYYKVNYGLTLIGNNTSPGWNLLLEQGFKAREALQSRHPSNFIWLLMSLVNWQAYSQIAEWLNGPVMCVSTLLRHLASEVLSPRHPVRLLVDAFLQGHISPNLCDMLFKAIDLNYTHRVTPSGSKSCVPDISLAFGHILVCQGRYQAAEKWFETFSEQCSKVRLTLDTTITSFRILAKSHWSRGSLLEAESTLIEAWNMLVGHDSTAYVTALFVLQERTILRRSMNDPRTSVKLLRQALNVAECRRFSDWG